MDVIAPALADQWYLLVALVGLVAWIVRLEAKVLGLIDKSKQLSAIWQRIDDAETRLAVLESAFAVVRGMLSPEAQKEHWTTISKMQADVEHIRRELEKR